MLIGAIRVLLGQNIADIYNAQFPQVYVNGLAQEGHDSNALAMKLCLSCTNPMMWILAQPDTFVGWPHKGFNCIEYLESNFTIDYGEPQNANVQFEANKGQDLQKININIFIISTASQWRTRNPNLNQATS